MNPSFSKTRKHIVLYDGDCPLCDFQQRALSWLDWFDEFDFVAISETQSKGLAISIPREKLLEAIHCLSAKGTIYRGARCIRFVGMRMPILIPIAMILWLPGVILIAEIMYRTISNNRHFISRFFGCKSACEMLPKRRQKHFRGNDFDDRFDDCNES